MERELHISKNQLSTHFDLALLILDEGSESHLEYTDLLKRMRYDHLIIDAIENSSQ